jgi:phage FluMu protein Com
MEINYHIELIKCPECNTIQEAKVEHSIPWNTYIHHCKWCEYVIMESEWDKVEDKEVKS